MIQTITKCRICENHELVSIIHLGCQALTGVFPKSVSETVGSAPLELVKCVDNSGKDGCGLVQLRHTYDLKEMYGTNYGYRSSLNQAMINHLDELVNKLLSLIELKSGDLVVDIGSNDATLLKKYTRTDITLLGIDPIAPIMQDYYPSHIELIPDFFPSELVKKTLGYKKAKVITSIAMFYDLEDPQAFVRSICEFLDDDGIWMFEQSYMPSMLESVSYDTICHEHLEFYRLSQIVWMLDKANLKIIDITFNEINGGSITVIAAKKQAAYKECVENITRVLLYEEKKELHTLKPYTQFSDNVVRHRNNLRSLIDNLNEQNKLVVGYGASTKGNVILQYCGITSEHIPYIAEVNEAKYGHLTPGTHIRIIPEAEARRLDPDYYMVLPWHYRSVVVEKEKEFINSGGTIIFPLPELTCVRKNGTQ